MLDDGAIKNLIKTSKGKVLDLLKPAKANLRSTLTQTMKAGFIKAGEDSSESKSNKHGDQIQEESDESEMSRLSIGEDNMAPTEMGEMEMTPAFTPGLKTGKQLNHFSSLGSFATV